MKRKLALTPIHNKEITAIIQFQGAKLTFVRSLNAILAQRIPIAASADRKPNLAILANVLMISQSNCTDKSTCGVSLLELSAVLIDILEKLSDFGFDIDCVYRLKNSVSLGAPSLYSGGILSNTRSSEFSTSYGSARKS